MVLVNEFGHTLHRLVGPALVIVIVQLHCLSEQTSSAVQLIERDRIAVFVRLSESGGAPGE